jgi:pyruvate kinase
MILLMTSPVAVALDLRGPEVRLGSFSFPSSNPDPHPDASGSKSSSSSEIDSNIANYIDIIAGQTLTLVTDLSRKFSGDSETVWVSCSSLPGAVKPGSTIFIDDGTLSLKIERSDAKLGVIHTKVVNSGRLYGNKGVIVSGIKLQLPALSDQDRTDVQFAVDNGTNNLFFLIIHQHYS